MLPLLAYSHATTLCSAALYTAELFTEMPGTKTNGFFSPRGPTRLQLSLQHAAADQEGSSPSVGQWVQFRNAELAGSVAGLGGDVCCSLFPKHFRAVMVFSFTVQPLASREVVATF